MNNMIITGVTALLKVKRLTETAQLPQRKSEEAAGLDLYADEDVRIALDETAKIKTGIAIALPPGTVGLILDRGSVGASGVHNFAGVIDADYRGEVIVVQHNASEVPRVISYGDRIAQLVVLPYIKLEPYEVQQLTTTQRGSGAFGSTGVN